MKIPVSVIIPVYNKEEYLRECIESVVRQTYLPEEIILVDDCSTDNSVSIIKKMQKRYKEVIIQLLELENNGGVSHARNMGMKAASCKYVTFLDADDFYWNKRKLENEYLLMLQKQDKEMPCCVYSKVMHLDESGQSLEKKKVRKAAYLQGDILVKLLTWVNFATVPRDYIVKKEEIMKIGGYDETRSQFEDLDVVYKLARKNQFFCTMEYGTAYRMTGVGLSSSKSGTLAKNRKAVIDANINRLETKLRKKILIKRNIYKKLYKVKSHAGNIIRGRF